MIEIKKTLFTHRLFADRLSWSDLFWPRCYFGYRGDSEKIPFYYHVTKGQTAVTDLTLTLDELLALMKSNTRNEIRRAIKEGCTFEAGHDYEAFIPYYNAFCESKGLGDRVYMDRLTRYKGDNELLITKALHEGTVLAMHATVVNRKHKLAYLILSCSQRLGAGADAKLIGWGNRYLHYKDFEKLKELGIEEYDWSGICTDPHDERYSIGQFKLSFGGKRIPSNTVASPLYVLLAYLRGKWIKLKTRRHD